MRARQRREILHHPIADAAQQLEQPLALGRRYAFAAAVLVHGCHGRHRRDVRGDAAVRWQAKRVSVPKGGYHLGARKLASPSASCARITWAASPPPGWW